MRTYARIALDVFGPAAPRMAGVWLVLNGFALEVSTGEYFHQPAFRLVAAAGLPAQFWGAVILSVWVFLLCARILARAWLCALAMLFTSAFLTFFGIVLVSTGVHFGVVSVNGCWCLYVGFNCMLNASPSIRRPAI